MKKYFLIGCVAFIYNLASAQEYRVIVGAFSSKSNAERLTNKVKAQYPETEYSFNPDRSLYYVIALKTSNRQEALDLTLQLQGGSISDAWLYCMNCPAEDQSVVEPVTAPEEVVQPEPPQPEPVVEEPKPQPVQVAEEPQPEPEVVEEPIAEAEPEPEKAKGKFMIFSIVDHNGEPIPGEVHFVNRITEEHLESYPGNTRIDVPPPTSLKTQMPVVCALLGYKEQTQFLNYENPSKTPGATQDADGVWTIPYKLELLSKKDVSIMYKVSFYKDAVIMLPSSKSEMDQLVSLMKLNPDYKIKIHGHANGNNKRKITALGDNNNFFNVEGSKTFEGTAKELSQLRAEAVQLYLVQNGIAKKRTKLYAWGNKNQLVSETSPSSKLNDRIEIEILSD